MKDFLLELFIVAPFILNGISIGAGLLLYLWLFIGRRTRHDRHGKNPGK